MVNKKKTVSRNSLPSLITGGKYTMTLFEEKYEESRKNIFIIENNTELLVSMQRAMYNEFNVFYASSSPGALDKITKIPMPDVIILNTLMEPVNGHPLHSEFSESRKFRHIPVIFISCQGNRKEKHECLKQGAVDYITIPFDNHELILKIKALLKMQHIQLQLTFRK
jgi:PleD family two-component response regulator